MHRGAAGGVSLNLRDSSHVRIGVLTFITHFLPDGRHSLTVTQADPVIEIADLLLEQADPDFVSVGDGIVTFHADGGDLSYRLCEYDDLEQAWLGVRSDVSAEDLEP